MAATLKVDFLKTGTAILSDSHDYPVQEGNTDEGINGTIRFTKFSWKRDLTVEFRSGSTLSNFLSTLATEDGLLVTVDNTQYYLDSLSCSSTWGGFGSADTNTVWEYSISLKRPYEAGNVK